MRPSYSAPGSCPSSEELRAATGETTAQSNTIAHKHVVYRFSNVVLGITTTALRWSTFAGRCLTMTFRFCSDELVIYGALRMIQSSSVPPSRLTLRRPDQRTVTPGGAESLFFGDSAQ